MARGGVVHADLGRRDTARADRARTRDPEAARRVRAERTRQAARRTHRQRQRPRGAEAVIPPLLRANANFRRFFLGQSVSMFGHLTWAQLYVVAFLAGSLSVVFFVAYGAMIQMVVPREQYVEANSLVHGSRAFSFLAGNSVGGVLVQLLRGPYALGADAFSFIWSALFLSRMQIGEPPGAPHEAGGVTAGVRWIKNNPYIRPELLGVA